MYCGTLVARANYNVYEINDEKSVVLYDDHRSILNVLNEFRKNYDETNRSHGYGGTYSVPNIFFFDRHDDARELPDAKKQSILSLDKDNERDFWNFVEFDASSLDDDWVCLAMELNLVKNVVVFGNTENDNIKNMVPIPLSEREFSTNPQQSHRYIGKDGVEHVLFSFESAFDIDYVTEKSNVQIENILNSEEIYILDFDLDCFSDGKVCWDEEKIKLFCESPKTRELVDFAGLVTICREPKCCGGVGQSNKILEYLDKYLFKGRLQACI